MTDVAQSPGTLTLAEAARIMRLAFRYRPDWFVWMYAIQAGDSGPVKLGIAKSPRLRMKTLQTGNAEVLRVIATWRIPIAAEKEIHAELAAHHIRGEWFRPHPEVIAFVQASDARFEAGELP